MKILRMIKKYKLTKQLHRLGKMMFTIPGLVWENEYKVDEEATAKVCPEYTRICEEYDRIATELNKMKHEEIVKKIWEAELRKIDQEIDEIENNLNSFLQ